MVKILLIIGSGSFLGGVSRYLASRYIQEHSFSAFPYGTFLVNIIGCLLIGIIFGISERANVMSIETRLFLTVGFCGGFTTFSTFAYETFKLLEEGRNLSFFLNIFLNVVLCLAGVSIAYLALGK